MRLELANAVDLPLLHCLIERAYRGDAARRGWTHEADLLGGQRTDAASLGVMVDDPRQHLLIHRTANRIDKAVASAQNCSWRRRTTPPAYWRRAEPK